jgi:hypothetical protein
MASLRVSLALVAAATLVVALASCGGSGHPKVQASPSSGVEGIALVGVGSKVTSAMAASPLPGGFGRAGASRPYPHTDVEVKAMTGTRTGEVVEIVRSDAHGLFRITLPPGNYRLTILPSNAPYNPPTDVAVRSGSYSRAEVGSIRF